MSYPILYLILSLLLTYGLPILYFTLFSASKWQATPAKRMLGLQVTTITGERPGVWRALVREVSLVMLALAVGLAGWAVIRFMFGSGLLFDKLTTFSGDSEVDAFMFVILACLFVPVAAFGLARLVNRQKEHAGLHDFLAGTRVIAI